MSTTWKNIWFLTLALLLIQMLFLYPALPERVISHFDFNGKPNEWMSKQGFLVLWIGIIIIINSMVPLTGLAVKKFPVWMISIPNKNYWFADEIRKNKMLQVVYNMVGMIASMVNIIFFLLFQYTYDMTVKGASWINLWITLSFILIIGVAPLAYMYRRLKVPTEVNQSRNQSGRPPRAY